ncbi:MAG: arylsulfatase [Saprospiraceae bacterium]|nr:arylsulfatase [Saprospiraceae bacterium]
MDKSAILMFFFLALFIACDSSQTSSGSKEMATRPNIVLIIGDDIGYSDIGCYGSEIHTPNLDRLAQEGIRFRHFYNMAKCNPTRSSMITGLYQGDSTNAISFASLLHDAGYSTIMSGKEHFDSWVPQDCYFAPTFDHSFTFWATTEYFVPPADTFQRPFYLEGKKISATDIEADIIPKYKTDFITDYAVRWLNEVIEDEDPFFLLLPYHAAHYPLQARPEDIAKYRGRYRAGWDQIREERYEKMLRTGVLAEDTRLSPPESNTNRFRKASANDFPEIRAAFPVYRPWVELSEADKDKKDLEMAVFAAMIDRMDQNIGRIIKAVEEAGKMENTIFLFFSDNGSCPFDSNVDFDIPPGPAESYRCLSPPWANVGNTPFRLYKQNGHEGGAKTHFIARYPPMIQTNTFSDEIGHVVDIFPTIIDLANLSYPETYGKKKPRPLDGRSLVPALSGDHLEGDPYFISGTSEAFRMFRKGDWKIVRQNNDPWELYNLRSDPTELNNLAESERNIYEKLISEYNAR